MTTQPSQNILTDTADSILAFLLNTDIIHDHLIKAAFFVCLTDTNDEEFNSEWSKYASELREHLKEYKNFFSYANHVIDVGFAEQVYSQFDIKIIRMAEQIKDIVNLVSKEEDFSGSSFALLNAAVCQTQDAGYDALEEGLTVVGDDTNVQVKEPAISFVSLDLKMDGHPVKMNLTRDIAIFNLPEAALKLQFQKPSKNRLTPDVVALLYAVLRDLGVFHRFSIKSEAAILHQLTGYHSQNLREGLMYYANQNKIHKTVPVLKEFLKEMEKKLSTGFSI